MLKIFLFFIVLSNGFFWREKDSIAKQMREQKKIVVSVLRDRKNDRDTFVFKGAGIVSAPAEFCYKHALNFNRLSELSTHFKTVTHEPAKKTAYLVMEALGFEARMLIHYKTEEGKEISWTVDGGTLKGMTGKFTFQNVSSGKSEVAIFSDMEADKIPLPSILAPFTLEIIAERVAQKMREDMESAFKNKKPEGR